ncbi:MAG TPA: hypothetical protein VJL84_03410 [Kiloniellales bacterium]|nr:hypothetical protein [Kiloniellales bacterium]
MVMRRRRTSAFDRPASYFARPVDPSPQFANEALEHIERYVPAHLQTTCKDLIEWLEAIANGGLKTTAEKEATAPPSETVEVHINDINDLPTTLPFQEIPEGHLVMPGKPTEAWVRKLAAIMATTDISTNFLPTEKHRQLASLHIRLALEAIPTPDERLDPLAMTVVAVQDYQARRQIFLDAVRRANDALPLGQQNMKVKASVLTQQTFVPFIPTGRELEEIAVLIKDDLHFEGDLLEAAKLYLKGLPMARFLDYQTPERVKVGSIVVMLWNTAPERVSLFVPDPATGKLTRKDLEPEPQTP